TRERRPEHVRGGGYGGPGGDDALDEVSAAHTRLGAQLTAARTFRHGTPWQAAEKRHMTCKTRRTPSPDGDTETRALPRSPCLHGKRAPRCLAARGTCTTGRRNRGNSSRSAGQLSSIHARLA